MRSSESPNSKSTLAMDMPLFPQPPEPHGRYVAMKDSWSHGDDRRDRGRVDRGVTHPRRSRSPPPRRQESDREPKARDRSPGKSRTASQHNDRHRDRSHDRRRRHSRSPIRDSREEVRERNRGRELLDTTRGSDKSKRSHHRSPSSSKRRKSRSPSPTHSHHRKSRRFASRSPARLEERPRDLSRSEKKRRDLSPLLPQRRSSEHHTSDTRSEAKSRHHRDPERLERRGRSPSPRRYRREDSRLKEGSTHRHERSRSRRDRSPRRESDRPRERLVSERRKEREERRDKSPRDSKKSPDIKHYEVSSSSRPQSPGRQRSLKRSRGQSPRRERGDIAPRDERGRPPPRDEYRPDSDTPQSKGGRPAFPGASGTSSIEVKERIPSVPPSSSEDNPNSIEIKSDKMAGRGYYQQGYNPNPMQAAFPLRPDFAQGPPQMNQQRQYSQSPQHHMTPNSYQGSPQAQSPYSAGRGNYNGQQQYSPPPQYPQNYQQQPPHQPNYASPHVHGPQGYYNNQAQSPPYQAPTGPMNHGYQNNFRGNQRAFRGNHFNSRGGRGDYRGRGGHFQNLHWNAGGQSGASRGYHNNSGNVTPQHASPHTQHPSHPNSHEGTPQYNTQNAQPEEEDAVDLFRPSKELQVEDTGSEKKKDEEKMPPPGRPVPTGPQQKPAVSFAMGKKKALPTAPRPEIMQKLSAGPSRNIQTSPDRPRGPNSRTLPSIPTEPFSNRRQDFRTEPPTPTTRKVMRKLKRMKTRPQLPEDFQKSDSVYYRKPGNESVVGSGTYGKVFKAVHVYTKDLVALKKIRMEGERDGFPVTAVREIKLLQSLKHSNIVNLREVMVEKNDCFMVFEYLSHDLTGLLNHPTFKLEPSHKKHLAKQLFEGLDYLHRRGVLHRDIKAANILVSNDGQLKLADFGLARFYAKRRQLDYTNRVITIWYRSPELLLGETQYGPAVDIWSAACVLVEIFTRHAIFPGDGGEISQLGKIYAVLGTPNKEQWPGLVDMAWFELLRPSARCPNVFAEKYKDRVTPAAFDLLEAMFQYDPVRRPSASEVLEHPYFVTEEPEPRQAIELAELDGEWHEFESKALRKENERKDKEARRLAKEKAQKDTVASVDKEKKRGPEETPCERNPKRLQMEPPGAQASKPLEAGN